MSKIIRVIIFYFLLIAIWEILFRQQIWPEYLLPSPIGVINYLIEGFKDKTIPIGIEISLKRVFVGYGFSLIVGIIIGLLLGRIKLLEETIGTLFLGFSTLPSICWLPLGILWFGLNEKAILFVLIIGSTFAIAIASKDGVKNIQPIYLKAAQTMGATQFKIYYNVILPAALPSIITGARLGWSFAWRSLMAGEMLFVSLGLGHLLMMGRELNDIKQVIGVMIVIVILSIMIDTLILGKLEFKIRERWGTV